MVKLTQIEDENNSTTFPADGTSAIPKEEAYLSSSDEEEDETDDEFDENEAFLDRLIALKDIVPPNQRAKISALHSSFSATASSFFSKSGSLLWVITSSALLLGVPLSLSILSEQQMMEMEKEMTLQQSSQEVLAPGSNSAFQEPKPATA